MQNRFVFVALSGALLLGTGACAKRAEVADTATTSPSGDVVAGRDSGWRGGGGGTGDGPRGGIRRGGPRGDFLLRGITLTVEQRTQVDAIHEKYRGQFHNLDPRSNADDRQKMRDLRQQELAEIRTVLTADQQKVYDQNLADMRERMQRRGGPGNDSARL